MMRIGQVAGIGACILLISSVAFAQQELLGTYNGIFIFYGPLKINSIGLVLQITSVESENMAGKLQVMSGSCSGNYSIGGKYSNSQLTLRTSTGDRLGCGDRELVLTPSGGKLVGKFGPHDIELSK
jgi:hypothetical protein